ncbi:uncharacterized protein LOC143252933 isoform X2 [Tachypleus tridentatus]
MYSGENLQHFQEPYTRTEEGSDNIRLDHNVLSTENYMLAISYPVASTSFVNMNYNYDKCSGFTQNSIVTCNSNTSYYDVNLYQYDGGFASDPNVYTPWYTNNQNKASGTTQASRTEHFVYPRMYQSYDINQSGQFGGRNYVRKNSRINQTRKANQQWNRERPNDDFLNSNRNLSTQSAENNDDVLQMPELSKQQSKSSETKPRSAELSFSKAVPAKVKCNNYNSKPNAKLEESIKGYRIKNKHVSINTERESKNESNKGQKFFIAGENRIENGRTSKELTERNITCEHNEYEKINGKSDGFQQYQSKGLSESAVFPKNEPKKSKTFSDLEEKEENISSDKKIGKNHRIREPYYASKERGENRSTNCNPVMKHSERARFKTNSNDIENVRKNLGIEDETRCRKHHWKSKNWETSDTLIRDNWDKNKNCFQEKHSRKVMSEESPYQVDDKYNQKPEKTSCSEMNQSLPTLSENASNKNNDREYQNNHHPRKYRGKLFMKTKGLKAYNVYNEEDATQRDLLTHQLHRGKYECMVCCEKIRVDDAIWSCMSCFHIFHLQCIKKWARSPAAVVAEFAWRCPACQNLTWKVPNQYFCFCGKLRDPKWNLYDTPHSCGEMCGKQRLLSFCQHRCTLQCHPGPCPPCTMMVSKKCECGKTKKNVRCNQSETLTCSGVCNKKLNCKLHVCSQQCHAGSCPPCQVELEQNCYCGKSFRKVTCTLETNKINRYSCDAPCGKQLDCGNHYCDKTCHPESCGPCTMMPEVVTHCHCHKTPISELEMENVRNKCTDPVPSCGQVCDKILSCGTEDKPHKCTSICHSEKCPPCQLETPVKCRCGGTLKKYPCTELKSLPEVLCQRRCNRKKNCGRHKCLNTCCVDSEHKCTLTCNRKLSCGLHNCPELCHKGNCPRCWNVSFEELSCNCGATVTYPPIACGTLPPECNQPCARIHLCEHPAKHTCHNDEQCPPCTVLTEKLCFGGHEKRNIHCFLPGISCGRPCNKSLSCGHHYCQQICHQGSCEKEGFKCLQSCSIPRTACKHPCGSLCHDGPCPETVCKTL